MFDWKFSNLCSDEGNFDSQERHKRTASFCEANQIGENLGFAFSLEELEWSTKLWSGKVQFMKFCNPIFGLEIVLFQTRKAKLDFFLQITDLSNVKHKVLALKPYWCGLRKQPFIYSHVITP